MPTCSLVNLVCPLRLQSQSNQETLRNAFLALMPSVFAFCKLTGVSPDQAVSVTLLGRRKVNVLLVCHSWGLCEKAGCPIAKQGRWMTV